MADEKDSEELELDNSGKKKKMIIIIIAIVVLLAGGGGAYFFFMGGEPEVTQEEGAEATESESEETSEEGAEPAVQIGSALYVPLPRPFRFNAPGAVRDRFVEIRVQLQVRGAVNDEKAKMHIPLIESTLLGVFSQANAEDLGTEIGRATLKQQSLASVQAAMMEIEGDKTVETILFTSFVMQ